MIKNLIFLIKIIRIFKKYDILKLIANTVKFKFLFIIFTEIISIGVNRIKNLSELSMSTKGEVTVVISADDSLKKNFILLEESDKKKINNLIKKMTIKNIVNEINKNKKIPKKLIYDYCLKLKNENK